MNPAGQINSPCQINERKGRGPLNWQPSDIW